MRVAWLGPTPSEASGAAYVGTQLLQGLAKLGLEIDCFLAAPEEDVSPALRAEPNLTFVCEPPGWEWDRWYSRSPMRAFLSGSLARTVGQVRLVENLWRRHSEDPYDVVYQFSQTELSALRRRIRVLPPILVHPSTHAAGELAWFRKEAHLARQCESMPKRVAVQRILALRAAVQRRDLRHAARVLGVSRTFSEYVARDYALPREKVGFVVNPIDLDRFRLPANGERSSDGTINLLFVSRMSARKGVDMMIALSHRLSDLAGKVQLQMIGGATTWSDYRPLLGQRNEELATVEAPLSPVDLSARYRSVHAVLQPARYEPFGLTVAEGLASGLPIVASDEVGAVDGVNPEVCRVFPAGDIDAFERLVREVVDQIATGKAAALAPLARAEAERLFEPRLVAEQLADELARASRR